MLFCLPTSRDSFLSSRIQTPLLDGFHRKFSTEETKPPILQLKLLLLAFLSDTLSLSINRFTINRFTIYPARQFPHIFEGCLHVHPRFSLSRLNFPSTFNSFPFDKVSRSPHSCHTKKLHKYLLAI